MKKKHLLKNILKFVVTVILFLLLFRQINVDGLKKAAAILHKGDLYVSVAVCFISVVCNALKWRILLPGVSVLQLVKTCFKAQFYSVVLPGQLFGEASKVIDLRGSSQTQEKIASSVVMDKVTSLAGMMVVGLCGLAFTRIRIADAMRILFFSSMCFLLAVMATGRSRFVDNIAAGAGCWLWKSTRLPVKKAGRKIYQFYKAWKIYAESTSMLFWSVCWGIGNQILGVLQVWLLSESMGLHIACMEYCWMMPAVSVILLLPVSFGGLGIRELSLAGFLALFDVAAEEAVMISVVLLLSQTMAAVVGMLVAGCDWCRGEK